MSGYLASTNNGLGAPRLVEPGRLIVSVTGADTDGSRTVLHLQLEVDSVAFMCWPKWIVAGGAQSGTIYGRTFAETDGFGAGSCTVQTSLPLENYDGEQIRLAVFPDDHDPKDGWFMSDAVAVSDPFPVVGTSQGRNQGIYDEPTKGTLEKITGAAASTSRATSGLLKWGTIGAVVLGAAYVFTPALPVLRDTVQEVSE